MKSEILLPPMPSFENLVSVLSLVCSATLPPPFLLQAKERSGEKRKWRRDNFKVLNLSEDSVAIFSARAILRARSSVAIFIARAILRCEFYCARFFVRKRENTRCASFRLPQYALQSPILNLSISSIVSLYASLSLSVC